ncbi:MAG TPA: phage tail protein, partial [Xanthomonadales bacterium]|nr:phage tail protein [Xanthomonadales bacterium]
GQSLPVTGNRPLFSVLGTSGGGDGKTTFKLPATKVSIIVAVGGSSVTSPSMLAQSGRHMTPQDSLGPGAMRAPIRLAKPPSAQVLASQRLLSSAVRVGRSSPVPVTPELASRFEQAYADARGAALAQLGANSRARVDAAVEAAVAGRISVYGAVSEMISTLTSTESAALLRINDAMIQPFNGRAVRTESQNPQSDAAHFLISVAITRDQARAMYRITRGLER